MYHFQLHLYGDCACIRIFFHFSAELVVNIHFKDVFFCSDYFVVAEAVVAEVVVNFESPNFAALVADVDAAAVHASL